MQADETIAALAALAHEHRLAAYRLLVEAGPGGMPAGIVAGRLGMPPSSLSFHLQHLLRADLITQRRVSRQLFYAANFDTMNALVGYLTKNCCGGEQQAVCAVTACAAPAREGGSKTRRRSV